MAAKRRGQRKKPRQAYDVSTQKKPRVGKEIPVSKKNVQWSFSLFDRGVAWHEPAYREETFREVADRLREYEGRTWGQIEANRKRDHAVSIAKFIKKARGRLKTLKLDDRDELWRFRFDGEQRIWGIRNLHVFHILWWDPQHQICPTSK